MIDVTSTTYVEIKASPSIEGIAADLGMTKTPKEPPAGKTRLGSGRNRALEAGCFPLRVYYSKGDKTQSATVLCSPAKADTIYAAASSKTYGGNPVDRVGPIRRVRYTIN